MMQKEFYREVEIMPLDEEVFRE